MNMSKGSFYSTHVVNMVIALGTSIIQTSRILKQTQKHHATSMGIKGVGLLVAGIGTLTILSKIKKGLRDIQEIKQTVRR
jgi:hypothetical protein